MKQLDKQTKLHAPQFKCAGVLMDAVPLVMRELRHQVRARRPDDLSLPKFRVLAFLRRNTGSTLSDVANHIGLTLPTMSKMIDGLVNQELVRRKISKADRRRIILCLTAKGTKLINHARLEARQRLAEILAPIPPKDLECLIEALQTLQKVFTSQAPHSSTDSK